MKFKRGRFFQLSKMQSNQMAVGGASCIRCVLTSLGHRLVFQEIAVLMMGPLKRKLFTGVNQM